MDPLSAEIGSKVAASALTEVFKSCYEGLTETLKWVEDKRVAHNILSKAAGRYAAQLEKRCGTMRILGMSEPVQLRSIYTRLNVLKKITSRQRESVKDLETFFDRDRRGFGKARETKPGIEAVNTIQKFILLGKPGAGKTTFLKHVLLQALDQNLKKKSVPIFIPLKDLSDSDMSLLAYIIKEFDICHFPLAEPFVKRALDGGDCILLLDGLDEVSKARENRIISEILEFSTKYEGNQFIMSCRIAAYNYCFEKFSDVELADFNDGQISTFISNWFGKNTVKSSLCWAELQRNLPIKELASIPLLLTLLCLAFDELMTFPKNRAELYEEALDALLKKWDTSRGIKREEVYRNLSLRKKETLFGRIAASTFENDQYFLPERLLKRQISDFINHLPGADEVSLEVDSGAVLKAIEAQHGLFVERARGIYSFSHLTFQEYFTAKHIVDNGADGSLRQLVERHLTDDKWIEVFLIVAGMLDQADEFLLLMKRQIILMPDYEFGLVLTAVGNRIMEQKEVFSDLGVPFELARVLCLAGIVQKTLNKTQDEHVLNDLMVCHKLLLEIAHSLARDLPKHFTQLVEYFFEAKNNRGTYSHSFKMRQLALDELQMSIVEKALTVPLNDVKRRLIASTELAKRFLKANKILLTCLETECYVSRMVRKDVRTGLLWIL